MNESVVIPNLALENEEETSKLIIDTVENLFQSLRIWVGMKENSVSLDNGKDYGNYKRYITYEKNDPLEYASCVFYAHQYPKVRIVLSVYKKDGKYSYSRGWSKFSGLPTAENIEEAADILLQIAEWQLVGNFIKKNPNSIKLLKAMHKALSV